MKRTMQLNTALGFTIVCTFAAGCSGIHRMETVQDAIDRGFISGLSSNQFSAVVWSVPRMPAGPYSKIDYLPGTIEESPTNKTDYVFFFGKSGETKTWEVFSCMKWRDGHWEFVPVKLPDVPKK